MFKNWYVSKTLLALLSALLTLFTQEDQISECTRVKYEEACKELGLITLNSMQPSSNGKYDIAAQGEGLVSEISARFQVLQANLAERHRGKLLFRAKRT